MSPTSKTQSILDRPLDKGLFSVDFDPADLGMAPVAYEFLVSGQEAPADFFLALYNKETKQVEMEPACVRGDVFRRKWRQRLEKAGQGKLYVRMGDAPALQDYFNRCSAAIMSDPRATRRKKITMVQEMAGLNLQLLFGSDLKPKDLEKAVGNSRDTVGRLAREPQLLGRLTEVLKSDYSVYSHSVNVSLLAMAFGRYLKLPESQVMALGVGGLLHDIGMARVPTGVLRKKDELSPDEMRMIRAHPRQGYQMLLSVSAVSVDVLKMILLHHENSDGSGYPEGRLARNTPFLARILRVVDAYDGMTSPRHHKAAQPAVQAANALLESMQEQFGADIVPAFIRFLGSPYVAG